MGDFSGVARSCRVAGSLPGCCRVLPGYLDAHPHSWSGYGLGSPAARLLGCRVRLPGCWGQGSTCGSGLWWAAPRLCRAAPRLCRAAPRLCRAAPRLISPHILNMSLQPCFPTWSICCLSVFPSPHRLSFPPPPLPSPPRRGELSLQKRLGRDSVSQTENRGARRNSKH